MTRRYPTEPKSVLWSDLNGDWPGWDSDSGITLWQNESTDRQA